MKLRQLLAAPFDFLANAIDPEPPRTFLEKLFNNPSTYHSLQSLLNVAYTAFVHTDQAKSVAASSAHIHDHIKEISDRLDKFVAEKLIEKGIQDPLPRPGEVLGDYIGRLEKARVGGLLWTWDDAGKRWAALDHHISVEDWTPEEHVGEAANIPGVARAPASSS